MTLLEYAFAPNDVNCGPDFIGAAKCLKQLFSIPYTGIHFDIQCVTSVVKDGCIDLFTSRYVLLL